MSYYCFCCGGWKPESGFEVKDGKIESVCDECRGKIEGV